jgi:hypothetical protein
MFREYEMVRLIRDMPELNLLAGTVGVVVIIYDEPHLPRAYEVDFSSIEEKELKTATLSEEDIERMEDL